jgi:hypothetical protein
VSQLATSIHTTCHVFLAPACLILVGKIATSKLVAIDSMNTFCSRVFVLQDEAKATKLMLDVLHNLCKAQVEAVASGRALVSHSQ